MIPIYIPYISNYKKSAMKAIEDSWISNYGLNVLNCETKLKSIFDIKYCILMNNGTSATHCLLLALKYKYPNINKIYIPNNVFIAPLNCALKEFASTEIEVLKINQNTFNMVTDEDYIQSLDKESCILVVHNLGSIVNVPRLKRLRPDIIFIEDNCEGIFGKYENIYSGTVSLCSAVSFYANKTITTGEGGAFFTNDKDIYNHIKSVYSHGMTEERYIHDKIAYNYRMTNIQAGFLYDQLNDLDNILQKKQSIFTIYDNLFKKLLMEKKLIKIENEENTKQSNWMYCLLMNVNNFDFQYFENFMNNNLIEIRPFFYDIRHHKHLNSIKVNYDELSTYKNGFMLPSYPDLKLEQLEYISNSVYDFFQLNII